MSAKAQHTPGPWRVGDKTRGRFCVYQDGGYGKGVCVMSNTQKTTADEVAKYGEHGDNLEADANARLIASAPELLAALEGFHPSKIKSHGEMAWAWETARAAIAKARGES